MGSIAGSPAEAVASPAVLDSPDPAESRFAGQCSLLLRVQVRLARLLERDVRFGVPYADIRGSLAEWGRVHGLGPAQARTLLQAGSLLRRRPDLEPLLLSGRIHFENAALLEDLLATDGAAGPGEDWVAWAEEELCADFRKRVDRRLAEVAAGSPVRHFGTFVPAATLEKFRRARVIESRKAGRVLTRGETLDRVLDAYLRREDPLRRVRTPTLAPPPARKGRNGSANIPEAEKRSVRVRFGDRCAVEGCSNEAFLHFAHVTPRALGGANEAWNLLLLCSRHHRMFDSGRLLLRGALGDKQFVDRDGRRIARMRSPPPGYEGHLWPVAATGPPG
jgi:hypothetical protein